MRFFDLSLDLQKLAEPFIRCAVCIAHIEGTDGALDTTGTVSLQQSDEVNAAADAHACMYAHTASTSILLCFGLCLLPTCKSNAWCKTSRSYR